MNYSPLEKVIHDVKALPHNRTPYASISQNSDTALNADLDMSRTTIRFIKCPNYTQPNQHTAERFNCPMQNRV
jgi:hypothetical protein